MVNEKSKFDFTVKDISVIGLNILINDFVNKNWGKNVSVIDKIRKDKKGTFGAVMHLSNLGYQIGNCLDEVVTQFGNYVIQIGTSLDRKHNESGVILYDYNEEKGIWIFLGKYKETKLGYIVDPIKYKKIWKGEDVLYKTLIKRKRSKKMAKEIMLSAYGLKVI